MVADHDSSVYPIFPRWHRNHRRGRHLGKSGGVYKLIHLNSILQLIVRLVFLQHWKVFVHVGELFILVPSLLGLKGNLDMCLASRLSTQANLGNMNSTREVLKMIVGNIALVQVQAIVASFLAAIFAIVVGAFINDQGFQFDHAMLVIASGMFTATCASFVLGEWKVTEVFGV